MCTGSATGQQLPGNLIMLRRAALECPSLRPAAAPKQILYSNLFPGSVTALSQKLIENTPAYTHVTLGYWSPAIAANIEDHRRKHGLVIVPLILSSAVP